MDHNPYKLNTHEVNWSDKEKPPSGYLDSFGFLNFLRSKGLKIKRVDNLPRFANNNNIKMIKVTRQGRYGSVPTYYLIPTKSKIEQIKLSLKNNNNSVIGKEILKRKKEEILKIFDSSKDNIETRTSIALKVSEKMGVNCNRKLVRKVLEEKRGDKLNKLKKER